MERLEYAKNYLKQSEWWNYVLFTVESKYKIFGFDGRLKVW